MSARKPKPVVTLKDATGDAVLIRESCGLVFMSTRAQITKAATPAYLTPAQARRVARALLRFADGGR